MIKTMIPKHPSDAANLQWAYFIGAIILGSITMVAMWRQSVLYGLQIDQIKATQARDKSGINTMIASER